MKKASRVVVNVSEIPSSASATVGARSNSGRKNQQKRRAGTLVSAPAASSQVVRNTAPSVRSAANGNVTISHREFVTSVGPAAQDVNTFRCRRLELNPALEGTFAWLSGMARLYESYRFLNLQFEFVPSCGTTTDGSVSIGIDYDAFDDPPTDKVRFMQNAGSVRGVPWSGLTLRAQVAALNKLPQRYTRQNTLADNLDIKTYDVGSLLIATDGAAAAPKTWGDLFVSYTITLLTPQAPIWIMDPAESTAKVVGGGTFGVATPFGDHSVIDPHGKLPVSVNEAGSAFTLKRAGQYLIDLAVAGAGLHGDAVTGNNIFQTLNGLADVAVLNGGTNGAQSLANATIRANVQQVPWTAGFSLFDKAAAVTGTTLRIVPWILDV